MPQKEKDENGKEVEITDSPAYDQTFSLFEKFRDHDFDRFYQHCEKTMVGFVQRIGDNS